MQTALVRRMALVGGLGWLGAAGWIQGCGGDSFSVDPSGSGATGGSGVTTGGSDMGTSGSAGTAGDVAASGAGGATGGSGGLTGGTGGVTDSEICLNGADDDGDQLADCEDPDCGAGFVCVPAPPAGWSGVGWVEPDTTRLCPDTLPSSLDLFEIADLEPGTATCNCRCEEASDVRCASYVHCYPNATCSGDVSTPRSVGPDCVAIELPVGSGSVSTSCMAMLPRAVGGSCEATATEVIPTPTWTASVRTCFRTSGGSCGTSLGQVCSPRTPTSALAGPCVARPGDETCPTQYPNKTLYYDGQYEDDRACGECECGAPTGGACSCAEDGGCTVEVSNGTVCGAERTNLPANGQSCGALTASATGTSAQLTQALVSESGTCEPTPGSSSGEVTPTGPVTVCCRGG